MKFFLEIDLSGDLRITNNLKALLKDAAKNICNMIPDNRDVSDLFEGNQEFVILVEASAAKDDKPQLRAGFLQANFDYTRYIDGNASGVEKAVSDLTMLRERP